MTELTWRVTYCVCVCSFHGTRQWPSRCKQTSIPNVLKVPHLLIRPILHVLWSLYHGVKQRENSIEDFVHDYSFPWDFEAISSSIGFPNRCVQLRWSFSVASLTRSRGNSVRSSIVLLTKWCKQIPVATCVPLLLNLLLVWLLTSVLKNFIITIIKTFIHLAFVYSSFRL